jgi:hypothetical protein
MLARIMQSILYNPGGWIKEWLALRFELFMVIVLLVVILLGQFNLIVVRDILPLFLLPFLIAGVSLTHYYLRRINVSTTFIMLFYVLLGVVAVVFPLPLGLFVIAAMLDSIFNFRSRAARLQ